MKTVGGIHVILDGNYSKSTDITSDKLTQMFDTLVDTLNMEYLTKPQLSYVDLEPNKIETEEDEGGISVYAQITTSHIALHIWPLRNTFCMDIFSCKSFDVNSAGKVIWENLDIKSAIIWVLRRNGLDKELRTTSSVRMRYKWQPLVSF